MSVGLTSLDTVDDAFISERADLAVYFGPGADRYLRYYDKVKNKKNRYAVSWNWWVFLFSFSWFFYRKQLVLGSCLVLLPTAVGLLFGGVGGGGFWVAIAMMANGAYLRSGLKWIEKADKLELQGQERADYLRRAGGTSKLAGGIAGFIYVCFIALAILGTVQSFQSGWEKGLQG